MVGSWGSTVVPKRMGTVTQTRWVTVTRQVLPSAAVSQLTRGEPWQVTTAVPTMAVGVSVSDWDTSTHCIPTLLHPPTGQDSSPV